MTPDPYRGPTALASSKYASPNGHSQFAAFPFSMSSLRQATNGTTNGTIATKEQIAPTFKVNSTESITHNSGAQLAMAQNEALQAEVETHSAKFARTVSTTMSNVREMLKLVRESIKKESLSAASELATVDNLWKELEELFVAAEAAKDALPKFLDQQKNNMSLYHNSVVVENMQENQEELNLQHRKVNIQHSLVLEQQQAFQDYKAKTEPKLRELREYEEKISRMLLEKGALKHDLDSSLQQLEKVKASKEVAINNDYALRGQVVSLTAAKETLEIENSSMRASLDELQDQTNALRQNADLFDKEKQKTLHLGTVVETLKSKIEEVVRELEQAKASARAHDEKFKNQANEHARAFTKLNEKDKEINTLTAERERTRQEMAGLTERAGKVDAIQTANTELSISKHVLQQDVNNLKRELDGAMNEISGLKQQVQTLSEKVKKLETENNELETKNKDLLAMVDALKKNPAAKGVDNSALNTELEATKQELAKSRLSADEWKKLAELSYTKYKEIFPMCKRADEFRQSAEALEKDNVRLKLELSAAETDAQVDQSNAAGGDAAYWKDKYECLLSSVG
ncbi:hypothetical protein K504DRAFT_246448 [Pleomassaria siparia CBS 279.74]|uniref:Uncharacterized protein n=1 Tax=Pleomassaria siparia CBS 279.74 TaxID=1314801 RepID=A0A6G1KAQ0_9PLEO|nr:hypothetical protein K504DRAFT_246448 [Pleomassaria siparia CBS 279.74]